MLQLPRHCAKLAHLACLLACAPAAAAPPVAAVTGPDKGRVGDIVILSASEACHVDWYVDASDVEVPAEDAAAALLKTAEQLREAGFTVEPPATDAPPVYLELDGGKRLLLASYQGTYRVHLAVSNADGVDQCAWSVTIGKAKPKPDPIPPPPDVEPVLPPGLYGLAIKSWRAAQQVQSPKRVAEAQLVAQSLTTAATATDAQAIIDSFAAQMKSKLTAAEREAWGPWKTAALKELQALKDAGRLVSRDDYATAYIELAMGLAAVSK